MVHSLVRRYSSTQRQRGTLCISVSISDNNTIYFKLFLIVARRIVFVKKKFSEVFVSFCVAFQAVACAVQRQLGQIN